MALNSAIGRAIALSVTAAALFAVGAARADSIYMVTATGIIDDAGQDYGIFGGPYGASLNGQLFSVVESFDIDQSTFNQGDQNEDLNPATVTATVTVGDSSITLTSSGPDNVLYLDNAAHAWTFGTSSPVYTAASNAAFYVQLQIFNGTSDFIAPLNSIGLDQAYYMTFASNSTGKAYFQGSDNSYFYGSLLTLRLAPPAERIALQAAVPEPGSLTLFLTGLFGLAYMRQKASNRARPAG